MSTLHDWRIGNDGAVNKLAVRVAELLLELGGFAVLVGHNQGNADDGECRVV